MKHGSDPRPWQIGVLASLLGYGLLALDFEVEPLRAVATVAVALATQWVLTRASGLPRFDPRSALISGLSLCLLLRSDLFWIPPLGAAIAVASKFWIRRGDKHVFNPTCLAIVVLLLATPHAWVSAGQWGAHALFAFAAAGLGSLVIHRTERSDVTWAFLLAWSGLVLGRAAWLGDPLAIPLHGLSNGALLIFAFFMISDPRTVPNRRAGRLLFACGVALLAFALQFGLFVQNPLLLALAATAPLVPLIDRLLPGRTHQWAPAASNEGVPTGGTPGAPHPGVRSKENPMPSRSSRPSRPLAAAGLALALLLGLGARAHAFCGFYVAKADARLFNQASQVVLVRDGDRTVITLSNDYQGDPSEFAMVVPVPTFVEREQIHVGDRALIDHLDAYTSPRLVEYYDPDPCSVRRERAFDLFSSGRALESPLPAMVQSEEDRVVVEATYTVGEYDIMILSAEESHGLARWLVRNGYRLPAGAEPVLESYLKQGMRFFVARVNLEERSALGFENLRPLQIAYESRKFMLPIRLGTLNANGAQELFVYTLTRKGRVETTNYRTVKLPTGMDVPVFVKDAFGDFYRALFEEQVRREDMRVVFTEYAWDMAWCDPCAADPLSADELRQLGVFWAKPGAGPAQDVFVTRLHVRYDAEHFPADLRFQETGDRSNFQGRYVLRHAFPGEASCPAAEAYRQQVAEREEREARQLASLTGWSLADVWKRIGRRPGGEPGAGPRPEPWWKQLW